jgi:subtilase family serine protease
LIASEVAWSGSGGGISAYESQPVYQSSYITSQTRAVPDVSYDADPNTGVSVYDSAGYYGQKGWFTVGGTSAGSPQWAALAAISDTMNPLMTPNNTSIYNSASTSASYATNFRDIITGSNGGFNAGTGYDLVTGLGSPLANNLTPSL